MGQTRCLLRRHLLSGRLLAGLGGLLSGLLLVLGLGARRKVGEALGNNVLEQFLRKTHEELQTRTSSIERNKEKTRQERTKAQ